MATHSLFGRAATIVPKTNQAARGFAAPLRAYYAARARTEQSEGDRYRRTLGAQSYSHTDLVELAKADSGPVVKRRRSR